MGLAPQLFLSHTHPMSATPTTTSTSAEETARSLTDLYTLLIHESPEVCSNCHVRIRDHEELDHSAATLGTGNCPTETLERAGDGVLGYDVQLKDAYGARRHYQPRTYCGSCGQPGGTARDDTPSKQTMLAAVDPLVTRLDEAGVPVNPGVLRYLVAELRSRPEYRGSETEIWRAAVALAADRARPRDCVRCTYPHRE
jgi:hypothetical protein